MKPAKKMEAPLSHRCRFVFSFLLIWAYVSVLPAAHAQTQKSEALVAELIEQLIETAQLPGFSVAMLNNGEVVYARGFGFADLENKTPVDTKTQFRIASVSKMLTVTALAKLVQQGRINLDAPISELAPEFPGGELITARMLSGHLSGVAHYQGQDRIDRGRHYLSVIESLDTFRNSPRTGVPGEHYLYTSHGYTLLSAIVECGAGVAFLNYLEKEIFQPLGMISSGPDDRTNIPETMSTLYTRWNGKPQRIEMPEDPSYKWGSGGLISTPTDLVKLANGYFTGFISAEVRQEMWQSQSTNAGEETGVGIGWRIGEDFEGRRVIHHAGSMGGARSVLILYPETQQAIATTTNVVWRSAVDRNAQLFVRSLS